MTPPPSFDRLAPAYHVLERATFGGLLHACRTAHLSRLAGCRHALLLGETTWLRGFMSARVWVRGRPS